MPTVFDDEVTTGEEALVAQWSNFGLGPGGSFIDDGELAWTEAPVSQLPYNAVVRTRLTSDPDARIDAMVKRFGDRGVQFMWVVHPSAQPADLEQLLPRHGLSLVGRETGMVLELDAWKQTVVDADGPIVYRTAVDAQGLAAYEDLIDEYWGLSGDTRPFVSGCNQKAFTIGGRGVWLLAYKAGEPVGKTFLSLKGLDGTASIWGVYVKSSARGYGIGSRLTEMALQCAAEHGKSRVVLFSTEMGLKVYRRIGFRQTHTVAVYASVPFPAELRGVQPH